ncbi:MAG: branched-chain amino acid ABC transporter permease [Burkholderiales bacterium]|nr:branched-chain amino acid ABC transporter permease [Burkholderiales bacterium]OJX09228.1 MAG: hypothetical protein BGO72_20310 [Burkholderiales bacterium 70-64]
MNREAPIPRIERATPASRAGLAAAILAILFALSLPWWAERSTQRLATEVLYTLTLAQLWNLLAGYGGMLSVGQQAFVGLGGYCLVALGMHAGLHPFVVVWLAGLVCAVVALPTAAIVFRLRGAYFAVGTWVVAEVFRLLTANSTFLGGGSGLSITRIAIGIDPWWRDALTLWTALALGVLSIFGIYALMRSRFGLALSSVRDDESAAASLGVSVRRVKWLVYVAAAAGCGMTGALIFITKLRIAPEAAYSIDWTIIAFFIVVIGGIGTLEGPLIGTLVYFVLRELLVDYGSWYLVLLGAVAVGFMLWMPRGSWDAIQRRTDLRFFPVRRRVVWSAPEPSSKNAAQIEGGAHAAPVLPDPTGR